MSNHSVFYCISLSGVCVLCVILLCLIVLFIFVLWCCSFIYICVCVCVCVCVCIQMSNVPQKTRRDIRADIPRTLQSHPKFRANDGRLQLERVLCAFSLRNPIIGYCQSMSHIVAFLLLYFNEENTFWFLCYLVDVLLPADYYSPSLLGARVDTAVFKQLIQKKQSKLYKHLERNGIDLTAVCLKWFMCLYLLTLPLESAARVWDAVMFEVRN